MDAKLEIAHGNEYPFDASDSWWKNTEQPPPPPLDWAHSAARGIISELQDRAGIKHLLTEQSTDEDTRMEMVANMAAIIREAKSVDGEVKGWDIPMEMRRACGNCEFWRNKECHRMPPQVIATVYTDQKGSHGEYSQDTYSETESIWPPTTENDFCGEFKKA